MAKLIMANWKSNFNLTEINQWMERFVRLVVGSDQSQSGQSQSAQSQIDWAKADLNIAFAPPHPFLLVVAQWLEQLGVPNFSTAAQDLSQFGHGSYTGAVCAHNLSDLPLNYVIVGHSERRKYFGESCEVVAHKVGQAVSSGLSPVICLDQEQIKKQAEQIKKLNPELLTRSLIAYEPVGQIGTGQAAKVSQVKAVYKQIQAEFGQTPLVYGGSVDQNNVVDLLKISSGVLVGTASLNPDQFFKLIQAALQL